MSEEICTSCFLLPPSKNAAHQPAAERYCPGRPAPAAGSAAPVCNGHAGASGPAPRRGSYPRLPALRRHPGGPAPNAPRHYRPSCGSIAAAAAPACAASGCAWPPGPSAGTPAALASAAASRCGHATAMPSSGRVVGLAAAPHSCPSGRRCPGLLPCHNRAPGHSAHTDERHSQLPRKAAPRCSQICT
jgi:hypothetical protein